MNDHVSHIEVEDDDGNVISPLDVNMGNYFSTWAMPRRGDKIQIKDRNGEWEVLDIIHTLTISTEVEPVRLRVRETSTKITEDVL